ncbi:flagellar hook-length control protein FliK [endosymbiont of Ridgeia piscesae]|jgi:hypothetical protein|uniref:Hook-length control protein FliK n=1 Tax=endosymbiont of Ridgeia piscesae TaxID=54398 RepID=A0A0T5YXK9_9GAMM|nr:flagellar hook-length control protein FliK [endosymbiont of Ridgeia piscesae]KRT55320.1 Flagellar hook-length control protein FliK [endosymbiont of Ridgeia piscesae]KRT57118.1 hook-length control protein FliK [endosymbiont of Ridgeia piscesae]
MHITHLKLTGQLSPPPSREQLLNSLKPGQLLKATALSDNINGSVRLQIGVTKLIAQTQLAIKTGQQLTLSVEKAGELPELKLVTGRSLAEIQNTMLKSILPRQQPLTQLFQRFAELLSSPASRELPESLRQSIGQITQQLLTSARPELIQRLREGVSNSGLFSERSLLEGRPQAGDLKISLLQLLGALKFTLGNRAGVASRFQLPQAAPQAPQPLGEAATRLLLDLAKQLDSGLARIETLQLNSLPQDDPSRQLWQFELPIRNADQTDLFTIFIKRQGTQENPGEEQIWSLTLRMNLAGLGPMRVQLRLQGKSISSLFWAEQPHTTQLLKRHTSQLKSAFERAGLEVTQIKAYQGIPTEERELPSGLSLLDEKA